MRAQLAYVTDLNLQPSGGGSYAVNWHAYEQLKQHFPDITPIILTPKANKFEQRWSQVKRKVLRQPGDFAYFSERTLNENARQVEARIPRDSDVVFFRSATRWSQCRPKRPYFVYLDVVFHTFFYNTFKSEDFSMADLRRIWAKEAKFLENASGVFFESQWGLDRAIEAYGLRGTHYETLGRGGVLPPPRGDTWDGESLELVTIAMNFEQKGGDILLSSFERLREQFPNIRWRIIGGEPPTDAWREYPEISYEGKLRPEVEDEKKRFQEILSNAFLLIHPTREDTSPLVLTEAAYFGCPAISVNKFGIPELVVDGKTGILLDPPATTESLVQAIESLIAQPNAYRKMRQQAREFALQHFSWEALGQKMANRIQEAIEQ